ncbi:hypothetical protein C8J56DRAFT_950834 [Mycena floridula]|nr:hypothetical protein C8J56DRAFT_950834 [Mycena floridula]
MEVISQFDGYTSYSDSSTPRTPSPHVIDFPPYPGKQDMEPVRNIFVDDDHGVQGDFYRPSLLQELYEHDSGAEVYSPSPDWIHTQQQQHHHLPQRTHDMPMVRRATFPYVRQDREDFHQQHQQQFYMNHPHNHLVNSARPEVMYESVESPHYLPPFDEGDHSIKIEDNGSSPMMVPTQLSPTFYRPPSSGGHSPPHQYSMIQNGSLSTYLSPHTGLPVQHTDDAASKETQYLRRRCFNCHTTEPPSWRRSTLNPGKIVCNKCGLYERTHLRPRPLRFDELRAGNKARKQAKAAPGSPKVKKEPREYPNGPPALMRRSSISSNSSVHSSNGANSDWDDSLSVYSSGSAPPTSFNSPSIPSFPLSRDSQSPPAESSFPPSPHSMGGIRLPNNPLAELSQGSLHGASPHNSPQLGQSPPPQRKAHSMPYPAQWSPSMQLQQMHMEQLNEDMMVMPGSASFLGTTEEETASNSSPEQLCG